MNKLDKQPQIKALMLLSSHCAYCPGVLELLSKMIKNGDISRLEVINIEQNPAAMQQYKVRSVPWIRIGKHELTGAQTLETLMQRVEWAKKDNQTNGSDNDNLVAKFDHLLSEGQAAEVIETIKSDNNAMQAIMDLLGDTGTVLSTRIGIGVIFEELADTKLLKTLIPNLGKLTHHEDSRIRADAYHYLGMTADNDAIPFLQAAKQETDPEIAEIISDSLEALEEALRS